MTLSAIKSFTLELDGPADAAFTGGEVVSGQVVLEIRRDTRVHSMKVQGRGVATAHWLENRGMNSVYNDYTSKITYFRKRQHLIRGKCSKLQMLSVPWMVNIPSACLYLLCLSGWQWNNTQANPMWVTASVAELSSNRTYGRVCLSVLNVKFDLFPWFCCWHTQWFLLNEISLYCFACKMSVTIHHKLCKLYCSTACSLFREESQIGQVKEFSCDDESRVR